MSSSEEALAPVTPGTLSPPLAGEEEEEEPASRASTVTDDGLNLNESQAMELFQILQKLEETKGGCEGGGGRKAGQTGKSGTDDKKRMENKDPWSQLMSYNNFLFQALQKNFLPMPKQTKKKKIHTRTSRLSLP